MAPIHSLADDFVNDIPMSILASVFCFYDPASISHLMRLPMVPLSRDIQMTALRTFIEKYIYKHGTMEMRDVILNKDYARFKSLMVSRCYFLPLYRYANQLSML